MITVEVAKSVVGKAVYFRYPLSGDESMFRQRSVIVESFDECANKAQILKGIDVDASVDGVKVYKSFNINKIINIHVDPDNGVRCA